MTATTTGIIPILLANLEKNSWLRPRLEGLAKEGNVWAEAVAAGLFNRFGDFGSAGLNLAERWIYNEDPLTESDVKKIGHEAFLKAMDLFKLLEETVTMVDGINTDDSSFIETLGTSYVLRDDLEAVVVLLETVSEGEAAREILRALDNVWKHTADSLPEWFGYEHNPQLMRVHERFHKVWWTEPVRREWNQPV